MIHASAPRHFIWMLAAVLLFAAGCWRVPQPVADNAAASWRDSLRPELDAARAESLAKSPALRQAIELAAERNPGVQAARLRWRAALETEPQALTPPQPRAQFGYQFKSVETRVGAQEWNAGLTQTVPWWRKLWAMGQAAATTADIARLRHDIVLRQTINDVKDAYYELYYLDQADRITEAIERLLRNEATFAYGQLAVGKTPLSEALRAESLAAQLDYDRLALREQRDAQAERLRALLFLAPDQTVGPIRVAPAYNASSDLNELAPRAETYSEVLKIKGLEVQHAQYQRYLAQLARLPDLTIGFNYIKTGQAESNAMGPAPSDSGKSPLIGMISLNLPIWEWSNRALIREKQALEDALKLEAAGATDALRAMVAQALYRVRLSERLETLYAHVLLPQAESVMRQSEIFHRAEQGSLADLLESALAWHNFQLALHRARADRGQSLARLEQLIGTTAEARLVETAEKED